MNGHQNLNSGDYGFPYIPLSQLRAMKVTARLYVEEGDGISAYDLWIMMVRNLADQLYAEYWHDQLEKARNYIGIEASPCPLCVYDNVKLIRLCNLHQQIKDLENENYRLRKKIGYDDYPGSEITTLTREEWDKAYLGEDD